MQKHITKKAAFLLLFFFCTISAVFSQEYVNREWSVNDGNPLMLQWSNSLSTTGGLITVGNTQVAGQGANILLTKYTSTGGIAWSVNYNTGGTKNDYGTNLTRDGSGNIYVCGMTDNNGVVNSDIVVLKYNSSGTLLWDTTYDSPYNKNDIATSILIDNSGNMYIAGSSEGSTTQFDFIALSYDNSGAYQWVSRYDYANLQDYGGGMTLSSTSGYLYVTGASASSPNNWDYTTVQYNLSGTQISVSRNNVAGAGYDQPYAYAKDLEGNIYITGKGSSDGIDYDMKTIKVKPNNTISWNVTDDSNNKNDQANAIDVNESTNDIIVAGYSTKSNNVKEALIIRYDSSGSKQWEFRRSSDNPNEDAEAKAVDVLSNGSIYVCTQITGANNTKDITLTKISSTGSVVWERRMEKLVDEIPTGLKVDYNEDIFIIYTQNLGASNVYTVEKFSQHAVDTTIAYDTLGNPMYMKNELLITFNKNIIDTDAINNTIGNAIINYADLSYFIDDASYDIIYDKLIANCPLVDGECYIKAAKLFPDLQTGMTSTVNRLGERIKVPVFWNSLRVLFPSGIDMSLVFDSLKTIPNIVTVSEPNYIIQLHAGATDAKYPYQYGLHPNAVYPNADINIEPAWDYTSGLPHIKTGVFDSGLNFDHPDFCGWGANNVTKVKGAYNFFGGSNMLGIPDNDPGSLFHGTNVAGIIGALRNRTSNSVAGIAGGNCSGLYDVGTSLYAGKIFPLINAPNGAISHVYNAIVMTSIDSVGLPYCWGLHITNNSWGFAQGGIVDNDTNKYLITKSVHFANRANVTFVAASGNEGYWKMHYPARIDDDWVLSVGGSDTLGEHDMDANFGYPIDVIAPYRKVMTISTTGNTGTYDCDNFGSGTSVSAPHVSGVAALLLSYMNDSLPNYDNLAPEDVEHIIELTATDVEDPEWDQWSGWGRLNGGKALQLVSKPANHLLHFGANDNFTYTKTYSLDSSFTVVTDGFIINDADDYFKAGIYLVDAYRIDAHVSHSLPANDTIVSYWARPSSSSVLDTYYDYFGFETHLLPRERVKIDTVTDTYADMHGYFYRVKDTLGNTIAWWPTDTSNINQKARFEYSILTHDKFAWPNTVHEFVGTDKVISLYPNPTGNEQTISFKSSIGDKIQIRLYDMSGRFLLTVYDAKSSDTYTKVISNIKNLPSGLYFYKIDINNDSYYLKSIKQ